MMMKWRIFAALIGLIAVLVGYYWVHKPLDPALIFSLGGAALDGLPAALLALVAGGVGRRILSIIFPLSAIPHAPQPVNRVGGQETVIKPLSTEWGGNHFGMSRAEKTALEGLLGLGLFSLGALALGLVGLYAGGVLWAALALTFALTRRAALDWLRDAGSLLRAAARPESGWARCLMLFGGLLLGLALLQAAAPPTAFDAINYHLVGPQRYLAAGRIVAAPDNHFLGFPQGVEILFGVAISLFGRDTAAAPVHALFGLLGLLAVGGVARRFAGEVAGWLAVTRLLASYSLWLLLGWPYVDLALLAYGAVALALSSMYRASPEKLRLIVLMGVIAGLALGVKYTAVGLVGAMALVVLSAEYRVPSQSIRAVMLFGMVAALVFLPWALKGVAFYGNPVYPFAFGGLNWDDGRSATFSTSGQGLLGTERAWQLLILPAAAAVFGVEKGEGFSFTAGAWLLTAPFFLLPLGWPWLAERAKWLAKICILLGLPLLAFWMILAATSGIGGQTRLMAMGLPVAAVAGALAFDGLKDWPKKPLDVGFLARALLALTLVFNALDAVRYTVSSGVLPYLLGYKSRDIYLIEHLGSYLLLTQKLAELPAGSTVRFLYEPKTYYCPPSVTCLGDMLFDHWPRALAAAGTPDAVFAGWQAAGDDYVLIYKLGYDFVVTDESESRAFLTALERVMNAVWSDPVDEYTLYQFATP